MCRRLLLVLPLVVFAVLAGGVGGVPTAWAHAGGLSTTSSEPIVLGVEPPVPGLELSVVEFGARLRLDNRTDQLVLVEPPIGTVLNALPVVQPGETAFWSDPRIAAAAAQPRAAGERLAWEIPVKVGETPVTVTGEQYWPQPPNAGLWWLLVAVAIAVPAGLTYACCRWPRSRHRHRRVDEHPVPLPARIVLAASTVLVICAHLVHLSLIHI